MKNNIRLLLSALFSAACPLVQCGNIDWHEWTLYSNEYITAESARTFAGVDKSAGKKIVIPEKGVDLNSILNVVPPRSSSVLLVKKVTVKEDTTVKLGMGVDWWFEVCCNKNIVYSTLRSGGNMDYPMTGQDHIFALNLRKGENIVAIYLKSGRSSFQTVLQVMPPDTPAGCISRKTINEIYNPGSPVLRQGPWLLEPAPGAITVAFLTDGHIGGGVEYRLLGSKEWKKVWNTIGGILQRNDDLHRIRLEGLESGKVYEYRVLIALNDSEYKALDTHQFTAPPTDKSEFEFFATSDTQFGASKRGRQLAKWNHLLKNSAFQVSIGDLSAVFDDFEAMLFGGYFNWQTPEIYHNKPFVSVRGNHEMRGIQRDRWFSLLGPASGEGYYAFRYGDVCFVVLDTLGDGTDEKRNPLTHEALKSYMLKQRKWVENIVNSPEYSTAGYRVVMSHAAPTANRPGAGISKIANQVGEPLFKASKSGEKLIHLYLAGHIHKYRRTVPGSKSVYANAPVAAGETAAGENFNFPIVIMDGPGKNIGFELSACTVKFTPDFLEVKCFDEESRCFDHFTVNKQGAVKEIDNPYKNSILKLYEF